MTPGTLFDLNFSGTRDMDAEILTTKPGLLSKITRFVFRSFLYSILGFGIAVVGIFLLKILILFLFPGLLLGQVEQSELYGTYTAEYIVGNEKLVIHEDGTYTQEVVFHDDTSTAETVTVTGEWEYNASESRNLVMRGKHIVIFDGFGDLETNYKIPKEGVVSLGVQKTFGRVKIIRYENAHYKKVIKPGTGT
jgi:hypothetical protein